MPRCEKKKIPTELKGYGVPNFKTKKIKIAIKSEVLLESEGRPTPFRPLLEPGLQLIFIHFFNNFVLLDPGPSTACAVEVGLSLGPSKKNINKVQVFIKKKKLIMQGGRKVEPLCKN